MNRKKFHNFGGRKGPNNQNSIYTVENLCCNISHETSRRIDTEFYILGTIKSVITEREAQVNCIYQVNIRGLNDTMF